MTGRKLFTNRTPYTLEVELKVRAGEDPKDSAETLAFNLNSPQSSWQEYGNNVNVFLNGINLTAIFNGQMLAQQA